MKRLVIVLSSLLVLPAFADVTPVYNEDFVAYSDDIVVDADAVEIDAKGSNVPVAQPSRNKVRGTSTANRAASRAMPATTSAANPRAVSARNTASSRNAAQARTATTVAPRATTNSARVANRPSRNASATTSQGVTSRPVSLTNKTVAARAGALSTGSTRVGVRSSAAIQARSNAILPISATAETPETTAEEKQNAIVSMDEITQMTDYCKAQYISCMDNFCNVLDDNQGRCSCSKNIKNYEKTENALKAATSALQDVAQQIQYIGLTGEDIKTLFSQTEAELAMQTTTDSTQLKNSLDSIKDMIIGIKTNTASSTETDMNFDLSGLLDFNINNTGFDLANLFSTNSSNINSISNQRGEQLYKTAVARCKTSVLNKCQSQGVDISVITNAYDLEIDKQCIAYEQALIESNDNMSNTVRNAKMVLQKARLMVAQQKNVYDLRGCVNALDSCMQDDFVCGTDYENCLDPSGKYIVNGAVVVGSTPGYIIKKTDTTIDPAPIQHTTGLYAAWSYGANLNAWDNSGNIADYIDEKIKTNVVQTQTSSDMAEFLRYKIGYIQDKKNYGMCASVLNKCQNYTYKNDKFLHDNQVVREYLQRTMTQIKTQQDEIIASYAENCLSDVTSCLNSNNHDTNANFAINACKAQIITCMSVNGDASKSPTPAVMAEWVGELLSQSSGGSSSSSTSNCYKLTINGTANGGSGNRTYYADSEGNIYNKAGCVGTTVTKIGTGTKTNASFAGIYLYASGNGAQCADASGNYNLTNCPITGDTTWYATYSCQTGYTENATTKACEATASLTMTIKDHISSPSAVKITNSNFVCNPNGDTKIVMSDYVTIDYTETEKIGLASGCIKLCYDPVVEGVEDNASQYCSTVPKTKCVNGGNMYILVDGYCVL